ncbi:MAG: acyl-ACP--UDP-N-acetylglucosamine O-acyltransferase [Sedimentisphaerales bacterium]|nr:acyl-ACP--UDP-N-acetylglucosamine O-acyltransferase [Sedimentisphaerales bacterium]
MNQIHATAVIEDGAKLEDGIIIGPNCFVGDGVSIGQGCILEANVIINKDVQVGKQNHFFSNCVIGGQPQILNLKPDAKLGGIVIGDDNTIREMVTIHPSMHREGCTKIGSNNLIMIGVHIGHDCTLDDNIVLSNFSQISGHCKIEDGVWLSGVVLLHQFVTIGRWCYAAGMTGINKDVPPFLIVSGHYPPEVRGVNKRGLVRAGLNPQQQKAVFEAYKRLYRDDKTPLLQKAREMSQETEHDENVRDMLDAIIKSSEHRYGRYLETFRH